MNMEILLSFINKFSLPKVEVPHSQENKRLNVYLDVRKIIQEGRNVVEYIEKMKTDFSERLIRLVKSVVFEIYVVEYLRMKGYKVFENKRLDVKLGIDLLVKTEEGLWIPVYIGKNTKWIKRKILRHRRQWKKLGIFVLMKKWEEKDVIEMNGWIIPSEKWLNELIDDIKRSRGYLFKVFRKVIR